MFRIRMLNENNPMDATSMKVDVENPISDTAIAKKLKANASGIRLSNRDTSQPENGKLINEKIGIVIRIFPSSALL